MNQNSKKNFNIMKTYTFNNNKKITNKIDNKKENIPNNIIYIDRFKDQEKYYDEEIYMEEYYVLDDDKNLYI